MRSTPTAPPLTMTVVRSCSHTNCRTTSARGYSRLPTTATRLITATPPPASFRTHLLRDESHECPRRDIRRVVLVCGHAEIARPNRNRHADGEPPAGRLHRDRGMLGPERRSIAPIRTCAVDDAFDDLGRADGQRHAACLR